MPKDEKRKLKFLIAHNGYLGQFEYFAAWLREQGHDILVMYRDRLMPNSPFQSVRFTDLQLGKPTEITFSREAENAVITATSSASTALKLRDVDQFYPDVVMAHCGWGTGLLLKNVWPEAVYIAYHEWFYRPDAGLAPEPAPGMTNDNLMLHAHNIGRNFPIISEFLQADANWSPNDFQRSQFPPGLRKQIAVMHDGVDVDFFKPDSKATIELNNLTLSGADQVVTYVSRGFEPLRKYPDFMRAVKLVQNRYPDTHFVIVGSNRVAYGNQLKQGDSWLHIMLDELDLDLSKIHFTGFLDKQQYLKVLQISNAHVYITEPFVLSWSFFEALSAGCAVISTDSQPVNNFIAHEKTGYLVDEGDVEGLAENIIRAITDKKEADKIGIAARKYITKNYSLNMQSEKKMAAIYDMLDKVTVSGGRAG